MNTEISTDERIFRYIVNFKRSSGGASPTIRQIMRGMRLSSGAVVWHLDHLIADGRIIRDGRHLSIPGEVWYLPATQPPAACHWPVREGGVVKLAEGGRE